MEKMVEKARELGRLLAQTDEYKTLKQANRAMSEDEDAKELVETLSAKHQELLKYMESGETPPEELREAYQAAFEKAQQHPSYQQLVAAQSNFDKVMERVNQEIAKGVEAADKSGIILPS